MKPYYYVAGLAILGIVALNGCGGTSSEVADNKKVAEAFERAFESGNCDSMAAFVADNVVVHQEAPDFAVNKEGKALMTELCEIYHAAFPDVKFDIKHVIGEGDLVALYLEASGTHTGPLGPIQPTGRAVSGVGSLDILRFKDGKIVEQWGLFDEMNMAEQAGWMEQPADTATAPQ